MQGGNKAFEFFIGPAMSGAHLHAHSAAWNGLVYGRKRWVITPPDKWSRVSQNKATKTPMAEWIKKELTTYCN